VQIQLLGGLDIASSGEIARKTKLVLAAIALAGARGISRAQLCTMFWPDRAPPQARSSLRQALATLRKAAGSQHPPVIAVDGDLETVRLAGDELAVDVRSFLRGIDEGPPRGWCAAADLYRGDLLAGVELPAEVDEWFATHRRSLRQQALNLVERMSMVEATASAAEALAGRLLSADATAEEAHRALIRIHKRQGHLNAALRQFDQCRTALQKELATDPDWETVALIKTLRADGAVEAQTRAAAIAPAGAPGPEASALLRDRDQPSVVVMPFDNLSGGADEYFADGVVEEITAALSRIRDFFVIARQSAFTYKGRFVDVREVGKALGVKYVVEGTVRRGGDKLRISVQLVDAETGMQLWSERYEGAATDLFEFQDQIATKVAGAMHPAVRRAEIDSARRKPPSSLRAYDLVMRAFPKLWGENADAINEAIAILGQAVAIDPSYGRAHALLAWCHALKLVYIWSPAADRDIAAARRAIEMAAGSIGDDPTALTAMGAALSLCGEQERASAVIEHALALDPNNAWAWTRFGWVAFYREEPDRAMERFERAMTLSPLDPFSFNARIGIAGSLVLAGHVSEGLAIAVDVINKHPEVTWAYRQVAAWSAMNGDLETARWAARKLLSAHPDFTIKRYMALPAFREMSSFRARMAAGMRQAGLPE
jgi:TolB-like protein